MSRKVYKILILIGLLICSLGLAAVINIVDRTEKVISEECFDNLVFCFGKNADLQEIGCYTAEDINYVFLPSFAEPGDLFMECPGSAKVNFKTNQERIVLSNYEKSDKLRANVVYEVEFEDESGNVLETGKLTFMKSEKLPAMFIDTESGNLEYLNENKENKEAGNMTLYSESGDVEEIDELTHITGRGNQTWTFDKKSYSIKLRHKADLFGMGKSKDWVLLCNVYDPSYIRNKITYEMAIASGIGWAPESQFIDLYVNGQYHGLYQLCEKVEIDYERINIKNLEKENELANPETNLNELQRVSDEEIKGYLWENEPKDISGGYLIERDYGYKYDQAPSGFISGILHDRYTIKSPERASLQEMNYISTLLNEMEEAIVSTDGKNSHGNYYLSYIDNESFANKYIIEELSRNDGGGATSAFYYKPEDSTSDLVFAGPVWDYDKAYGRVKGVDSNTGDICYSTLHFDGTLLYYYLYQKPEFYEEVTTLYQGFYSSYLEQLAEGDLIDKYCQEIEAATYMDRIRWKAIWGDVSYRDEAERIRQFIRERKTFLDTVWIENKSIYTVKFMDEENEKYTFLGVIENENLQTIPECSETADKVFIGWIDEDSHEEFDINSPITKDKSVIAAWK